MSAVPPAADGSPPPPAYPSTPSLYPSAPPPGAPAQWLAPGPAPGLAYAGFGARFLGYVIDVLLLTVVEATVTVPFVFIPLIRFYRDHPAPAGQPIAALPTDLQSRFLLLSLVGAAVSALYFGGLVALQGRTLGQRVVSAYVVRAEDGGLLPPGRSFLRAAIFWGPGLLGIIPFAGSVFGLVALVGMLAVAWDPRKQGWHDKLGRSFVVKPVPR